MDEDEDKDVYKDADEDEDKDEDKDAVVTPVDDGAHSWGKLYGSKLGWIDQDSITVDGGLR